MQFLFAVLLSAALVHARPARPTATTAPQGSFSVYQFSKSFTCLPPDPRRSPRAVAERDSFDAAEDVELDRRAPVPQTTTTSPSSPTQTVTTNYFKLQTTSGFAMHNYTDGNIYFSADADSGTVFSLVGSGVNDCQLAVGPSFGVLTAPLLNPSLLGSSPKYFTGWARCGVDFAAGSNAFYCQQSQKKKLMTNYVCNGKYALGTVLGADGCTDQITVTAVPVAKPTA